MSSEHDKAAMSRLMVDLFEKGDFQVADELVWSDFVEHSGAPGLPAGILGLTATARIIRAAFPDFHITVEDALAEGDRVCLRLTEEGTQNGELFGMPPSGKRARWSAMHLIRMKEGKMAEHWDVIDFASMRQQLAG